MNKWKAIGLCAFLAWAAYMTWAVTMALSMASIACDLAADIYNEIPGPGLDSTHKDVIVKCG
jgi:hypothetical protein